MSKYTPEKGAKRWAKCRLYKQEVIARMDGRCAYCGATGKLEFDHIDPKTKLADLADLWLLASRVRLDAEIAKCQLLCGPCHRIKSVQERPKVERKPIVNRYKRKRLLPNNKVRQCGTLSGYTGGCKCEPCRDASRLYGRRSYARNRKLLGLPYAPKIA